MGVVLRIVNQSEWRYRTGAQAEVFLHAFLGCKRQFSLMESLFEVVDGDILVAVEHHKVVAVAFVVAEKEVLAVLRAIVVPILASNLDSWGFGMVVGGIFYAEVV